MITNKTFFSGDTGDVVGFLHSITDIRKHLCFSCNLQRLYDDNGKEYRITRTTPLDKVKKIVEEIRTINAKIRNTSADASK